MATFFDKQSGKAERTAEQIEAKMQQRPLDDETVVTKQELDEDELDQATGGASFDCYEKCHILH